MSLPLCDNVAHFFRLYEYFQLFIKPQKIRVESYKKQEEFEISKFELNFEFDEFQQMNANH